MATSLYFVDDVPRVAPTAGTKGNSFATLPKGLANTYSLSGTEGTLSAFWGGEGNIVSRTVASQAIATTQQSHYFGRFSSRPLAAQTIPAQNWDWSIKISEGTNAAANTFLWPIMYVWRPSTNQIVGNRIFDANANASTEWPNTVGAISRSLAGTAVTVADGDILVVECWAVAAQGSAAIYTNTWVTTSNLSKIVSPYTLLYVPETVYWFTTALAGTSPTAGSKANPTYLPKAINNNWSGAFESLFTEVAPLDTNQTGRSVTTTGTLSQQSMFLGRSSTNPLAAQTIPAQTWSFEASIGTGNALANTYFWPVMYIWRPSTNAVVNYIMQPTGDAGLKWRTNADPRLDQNFAGSSVVVAAGDILCCEVWGVATQSAASPYTETLWTNSFNSRIVSPYVIAPYVAPVGGRRQRCVQFN